MEIIFIGLAVLGPFVFMFFYQKSQTHKTALLREHFASSDGEWLPFEGVPWRLRRVGAKRGSFPQLWCYLEKRTMKLCLGHERSRAYAPFWVTKKRSQIVEGLCVAAQEPGVQASLVTIASGPLNPSLRQIFDRDFCHLTIDEEWHLRKWRLEKKTVLRFTCPREDIYQAPQKLEETMKVLAETVRALGLEFESL